MVGGDEEPSAGVALVVVAVVEVLLSEAGDQVRPLSLALSPVLLPPPPPGRGRLRAVLAAEDDEEGSRRCGVDSRCGGGDCDTVGSR